MVWLIVAGVALALIGAVIWLATRAGRATAERDIARTGVAHAKEANAIDENVGRLDVAALDSELRQPAKH